MPEPVTPCQVEDCDEPATHAGAVSVLGIEQLAAPWSSEVLSIRIDLCTRHGNAVGNGAVFTSSARYTPNVSEIVRHSPDADADGWAEKPE